MRELMLKAVSSSDDADIVVKRMIDEARRKNRERLAIYLSGKVQADAVLPTADSLDNWMNQARTLKKPSETKQ